mmetsp:Transcript_123169/g.320232  ORF Transcript_123169/g.320232 Transcript_123169/m.320232 type:complete len:245 (+) Transcript_123169:74-808(+)
MPARLTICSLDVLPFSVAAPHAKWTVADLKREIELAIGVPQIEQCLQHGGVELQDWDTLESVFERCIGTVMVSLNGSRTSSPPAGWQCMRSEDDHIPEPVSLLVMQQWNDLGFFRPGTLMRCDPGSAFVPLQELFPPPLVPFESHAVLTLVRHQIHGPNALTEPNLKLWDRFGHFWSSGHLWAGISMCDYDPNGGLVPVSELSLDPQAQFEIYQCLPAWSANSTEPTASPAHSVLACGGGGAPR